jgi:oligosaccharyltransferase complex subunit delta (ribophorin II)
LRLTSAVSGKTAFFAAGKSTGDKLEIVATSSGIEDQMGTQGGAFDTLLIVGSSNPAAAVQWSFGQVEILHRPTPDGNQPPAPKTRMELAIKVKPEIVHQRRVPEKRAPAIVSLVFTVIMLVPVAAFVLAAIHLGATPKVIISNRDRISFAYLYIHSISMSVLLSTWLMRLKANLFCFPSIYQLLQAFPETGSARVYALGFHGGIAALLVLYLMFWLNLNLMQTFPVAAVLEIVIFVFGTKVSALADGGTQKATKQE